MLALGTLAIVALSAWFLPVVALPASARTTFAPLPLATLLLVLLAIGLKLLERLPLVRGELGADGEKETRIGFLQLGASGSDLVDLRQNLAFVGLVVAHQGLHLELSLLEVGVEVNQLFTMREQRGVELLALRVGELERVNNLGIVPPAAVIALGAHGLFEGRPVLTKAGAASTTAHAPAGALSQRGRRQQSRNNHKSKTCSQTSSHCFLLSLILVRDGIGCWAGLGARLFAFVLGHLSQGLHGARNLSRDVAIDTGEQVFFVGSLQVCCLLLLLGELRRGLLSLQLLIVHLLIMALIDHAGNT